jgi:IS30 family transposase
LNITTTSRNINKSIEMKVLITENELLIQSAIDQVENGDSARAIAKRLGLNHVTLSRRVRNRQYNAKTSPNNRKLSEEAEELII